MYEENNYNTAAEGTPDTAQENDKLFHSSPNNGYRMPDENAQNGGDGMPGGSYCSSEYGTSGNGQSSGNEISGNDSQSSGSGMPGSGYQNGGNEMPGSGYQNGGNEMPGSGYQNGGNEMSGRAYQGGGNGISGGGYQSGGNGMPGSGYQSGGNGMPGSGYQNGGYGAPGGGYQSSGYGTGGYPGGAYGSSYQNYPVLYNADGNLKKKDDSQAFGIVSLVLGIISLLLFCTCISIPLSVMGLIFGIIQLVKSEKKGMAIGGVATAGTALLLTVLLYAFLFTGDSTYEDLYREWYEDYDYLEYETDSDKWEDIFDGTYQGGKEL